MNLGIINSLEHVMELFDNPVGFATNASFSTDLFMLSLHRFFSSFRLSRRLENPSVSEDFVIGILLNYIIVASLSGLLTNFKISTIVLIIKE
jgi:hypothetical protein